MELGICKLCGKEKDLVRSHVIPEFMYADLRSKKGGGMVKASLLPFSYKPGKALSSIVSTGIYDTNILCARCDNEILGSLLEDYGKSFIFGNDNGQPTGVVKHSAATHIELRGVDYGKIKLFFLSVLWRVSVSKHEMFKGISLGSKHEEAIRMMILNNDPMGVMDYPFMVYGHFNKTSTGQIICPPMLFREHGSIRYKFFMGRVTVIYYVSPQGIPPYVKSCTPNPIGEMVVFVVDEKTDQILLEEDFIKPMLKSGLRF